jgi:hypothetical protein
VAMKQLTPLMSCMSVCINIPGDCSCETILMPSSDEEASLAPSRSQSQRNRMMKTRLQASLVVAPLSILEHSRQKENIMLNNNDKTTYLQIFSHFLRDNSQPNTSEIIDSEPGVLRHVHREHTLAAPFNLLILKPLGKVFNPYSPSFRPS